MTSYDRRPKKATHTVDILEVILRKAVSDKNFSSLVQAYNDELIEEWEEDNGEQPGGSVAENEAWQKATFGMLISRNEIETAFTAAYVPTYRRIVQGASVRDAMGVMDMSPGMPSSHVPRAVVKAVAEAVARRDAVEANALLSRGRQGH